MEKVVVGMSGGVDSAVCAYLLKEAGYDVLGVTLRTWLAEDGTEGRCCEIDDARSAAFKIGVPFYPVNCTGEFREKIIEPFVDSYLHGQTPNPCIDCNRFIKFDALLDRARELGCDYISTGHYARTEQDQQGGQPQGYKGDWRAMCFSLTVGQVDHDGSHERCIDEIGDQRLRSPGLQGPRL